MSLSANIARMTLPPSNELSTPRSLALLLALLACASHARAEGPDSPRNQFDVLVGETAPVPFNPKERIVEHFKNGKKRPDLILYNRVPKSGSSSMQDHIDESEKLGFKALHFIRPPKVKCEYNSQLPCLMTSQPVPEQREVDMFINFLNSAAKKYAPHALLVDYHFRFVDFEAAGIQAPVNINTIRHPVDRLESHFLYARYGPRSRMRKRKFIEMHGNLSIPECLELYRGCNCSEGIEDLRGPKQCEDCTRGQCLDLFYSFNIQMMYFCPWGSPKCATKGREALEEAKRIVQEQYEAIGVLELMHESLEVFEATFPRLFHGVSAKGLSLTRFNDKKAAYKMGEDVYEELEELNSLDMEFYRFVSSLLIGNHRKLAEDGHLPG